LRLQLRLSFLPPCRSRTAHSGRRRCMRAFAMASCGRCGGAPSILPGGTIRVEESWDPKEGAIAPKTRTSRRTTPLPGLLRDHLLDHKLMVGEIESGALVFGREGRPFQAAVIYRRADRALGEAGLGRLRLHQARHTYASFMIAAGVNAKALSSFMGHSSIKVTFDLYGHLMPGAEVEAAALLDRFLSAEVLDAERGVRAVATAS
jgi:integrase